MPKQPSDQFGVGAGVVGAGGVVPIVPAFDGSVGVGVDGVVVVVPVAVGSVGGVMLVPVLVESVVAVVLMSPVDAAPPFFFLCLVGAD